MQKFDALNTRMDTYRRWLDELAVTRRQMAETQAPDGPQLESLQTQLSDLQNEPGFYGKKQKLQQQIADIQDRRQTYIDDFTSRDTPDMARVRQELMKADYAKRDLAPAVFRAYQDAKDLMPEDHAELPAPEATQPEASAEPVDETATASRAPEVPTAPAKVEEITAAPSRTSSRKALFPRLELATSASAVFLRANRSRSLARPRRSTLMPSVRT